MSVAEEQIVPGAIVVGKNGRRRQVISLDADEDGTQFIVYEVTMSSQRCGHRNGIGYAGMCQMPQMLRWARKVLKGDQ